MFRFKKTNAIYKQACISLLTIMFFTAFIVGCQDKKLDQAEPQVYSFKGAAGWANSYILAAGGKAAVIDPVDYQAIIAALKERNLTPTYIILTHGHFDHIAGIDALLQVYPGLKVFIKSGDADKLADPGKNLSTLFGTKVSMTAKTGPLDQGTSLNLGGTSLEVILTPGHTLGSICLKAGNLLFTGDTLFQGSVGRVDFPDGNEQKLIESLQKLVPLSDNTRILPGHGEPSTIGEEKKSNPFFANR